MRCQNFWPEKLEPLRWGKSQSVDFPLEGFFHWLELHFVSLCELCGLGPQYLLEGFVLTSSGVRFWRRVKVELAPQTKPPGPGNAASIPPPRIDPKIILS